MRTLILVAGAVAVLAGAGAASAQAVDPAQLIKMWDKDSDDAISKAEWTSAGRPAERFDLVDANKDGKISKEELAAAIKAMQQKQGK